MTYSPFSYHDPGTNQLTGYDIEVVTAVASKLGARAEFVEAPFVTKKVEREGKYALSDPYTEDVLVNPQQPRTRTFLHRILDPI